MFFFSASSQAQAQETPGQRRAQIERKLQPCCSQQRHPYKEAAAAAAARAGPPAAAAPVSAEAAGVHREQDCVGQEVEKKVAVIPNVLFNNN